MRTIERYLERTGTSPSRLGRDAVGDPHLVKDVRNGRELRPETVERLKAHMRRTRKALG